MTCQLAMFFHVPSMGGRSFKSSVLAPNFECFSVFEFKSDSCKKSSRFNINILKNYTFVKNKKFYIEFESFEIGKPLEFIEKNIRSTYESFGCKLWTLTLLRHPYRFIQSSYHHFGENKALNVIDILSPSISDGDARAGVAPCDRGLWPPASPGILRSKCVSQSVRSSVLQHSINQSINQSINF